MAFQYLIAYAAYMLSCIRIISATPLLDILDERKVGDMFSIPSLPPQGWTCKVMDQDTNNNGLFSLGLNVRAFAAAEAEITDSSSSTKSSVLTTTYNNAKTVAVAITVTMEGSNTINYFDQNNWKTMMDKFESETISEGYPKDIFWTCVAIGVSVTAFTVVLSCETEDTVPPS